MKKIKEDTIGRVCSMYGSDERHNIFFRKRKKKDNLGTRNSWELNIKSHLKKQDVRGQTGIIHSDKIQHQVLMNTIMNLRVPYCTYFD
jgi:hypothetical protein